MSIPIKCPTCRAPIGVKHSHRIIARALSGKLEPINITIKPCPGKENHLEPIRTEKEVFKSFGWLWMKKKEKIKTIITIDYPETGTRSVFEEYENGEVKVLDDLCI